jgi:hypothetical protein
MTFSKTTEKAQITVSFSYEESCKNVYKHFGVVINGKNSNIKGLRRFLTNPDNAPDILTANTYFWHSCSSAPGRRSNENKRMNQVRAYFITEGFTEA